MRAAIYLRISLDQTGEHLAVSRQRADCAAIVESRGWLLYGEYLDNSLSATDASKVRPSYDRMVADYETGLFDAIVCWDLDRLTRQPRQLEDWIDRAEKRGLALVTANGEADLTTDAGRLFARIKVAVAKSEVERKSRRQKRQQQQRAEMGKPPAGGNRLTGYTSSGEIVADEAFMVQTIFERFSSGDSLRGIASWLQAEGFPTRSGGTWTGDTVSGILRNPRYAGRSMYKGVDMGEGQWPALIDAPTFNAVSSRLAARATGVTRERKWLGSGLYFCECGRRVRGSGGSGGHRYACRDRCYYRTAMPIDEMVTKVMRARLGRPDLAGLLSGSEDAKRLGELNFERQKALKLIETFQSDYNAGYIDGRRLRAATDLQESILGSIERKEARIIAAMGPTSILGAPDPVHAFDSAALGMKQLAVDVLMRVTLHRARRGASGFDPDSVTIEWA